VHVEDGGPLEQFVTKVVERSGVASMLGTA
jgi:hypothetical protein